MPAESGYKQKTLVDFLSEFSAGMNSGVQPLLLPKNQLAYANNCTVQTSFLSHRPPRRKITLDFGGNESLENAVTTGIYQGGGYYRPDFGTESLIASISGRLYKFTENGLVWTVTDITVPGNPNAATTSQTWMWQSEKWMIVQDGSGKLPIFYDGVASRRSYGPSVLLGTVFGTPTPANPPLIDGAPDRNTLVSVTLTAPYTGPYNVPVLFNGAFYQTVQGASGTSNAALTNVAAVVGHTIPVGSNVVVRSGVIGTVTDGDSQTVAGIGSRTLTLVLSSVSGLNVGNRLTIPTSGPTLQNEQWDVELVNSGTNTIVIHSARNYSAGVTVSIAVGALVQLFSSTNPDVVVGVTSVAFNNPAVGATTNISLASAYTGTPNQIVWIGNDQYSIAALVPSSAVNIYLINLSDTSTAAYASGLQILSVPELPAGRMGAYGMGRNWMSLVDGISFIGGDIVGGASGTVAENYRDAVLKTTENTFQNGPFRLPGTGNIITAMIFTANLDQALGQGPLQVATADNFFSVNTPVDSATWATLTFPILTESLIGLSALGQNSTILSNSDTLYRSYDGLGSLILARRDFGQAILGGNTPISQEVRRILDDDTRSLLSYGSAITFDNRFLTTAKPASSGNGVYHRSLVAMCFSPISNLRTKLPAVYDGEWTGLNVLQQIQGTVGGTQRAFMFTVNTATNKIELHEQLIAGSYDNETDRISWGFETPIAFNQDVKPYTELCRLRDGEIYIQDIVGQVDIEVQYRPDFNPEWTSWRTMTVNGADDSYRMRLGLGEPSPEPCERGNNRPMRVGYFFQYRVLIKGSCKFMGMRTSAITEPQTAFAIVKCD